MRLPDRARNLSQRVGEKLQRPRRGDARVELAQAPGCGVARVGEDLFALGREPVVHGGKIRLGHVDFAAHFDHVGKGRPAKARRHVL